MSSPGTSGIVNSAEPAYTSMIARLSVSDIVSSSTGDFVCCAAASCGKYRRITVGRLNTFAGSVTFSSSCRHAVANRSHAPQHGSRLEVFIPQMGSTG